MSWLDLLLEAAEAAVMDTDNSADENIDKLAEAIEENNDVAELAQWFIEAVGKNEELE